MVARALLVVRPGRLDRRRSRKWGRRPLASGAVAGSPAASRVRSHDTGATDRPAASPSHGASPVTASSERQQRLAGDDVGRGARLRSPLFLVSGGFTSTAGQEPDQALDGVDERSDQRHNSLWDRVGPEKKSAGVATVRLESDTVAPGPQQHHACGGLRSCVIYKTRHLLSQKLFSVRATVMTTPGQYRTMGSTASTWPLLHHAAQYQDSLDGRPSPRSPGPAHQSTAARIWAGSRLRK